MKLPQLTFLALALCLTAIVPLTADEAKRPAAQVTWETDYLHAMDLANQQRKMLVLCFQLPDDPAWQRFERETLANADVQSKLQASVCLRLPMDASVDQQGQKQVLLQHTAFYEMLNRPGVAVIDFVHDDPNLHGTVVSTFPLAGNLFYGPAEMNAILDLPPGSLTQRTLIYAVRIHPERPASARGAPDSRLVVEAESHSQYQAQICVQGHHGWGSRFPRIAALVGGSPREVCAESWAGQNLVESAVECVRCWRLSSGHWSAVRASNCAYGYDMKRGRNGVWYATGIFSGG